MMNDKQLIEMLTKIAATSNMVDDNEAANILGIKNRTLFNRVSGGKYSSLYTVSPITGKRFWYRDKIMGL